MSDKARGYYGCFGTATGACDNKMLVRRKLAETVILEIEREQLDRFNDDWHIVPTYSQCCRQEVGVGLVVRWVDEIKAIRSECGQVRAISRRSGSGQVDAPEAEIEDLGISHDL